MNSARLPGLPPAGKLFHMTGVAIKDFRFLIQAYKEDKSIFSKEFYRQVLYDLGAAYQRIGETGRARKVRGLIKK